MTKQLRKVRRRRKFVRRRRAKGVPARALENLVLAAHGRDDPLEPRGTLFYASERRRVDQLVEASLGRVGSSRWTGMFAGTFRLASKGRALVERALASLRPASMSVAGLRRALAQVTDPLDGRCGSWALALAEVLPGARFVVAVNRAQLRTTGKWSGHVALLWSGRLWDSRGELTGEVLEFWGMGDPRQYVLQGRPRPMPRLHPMPTTFSPRHRTHVLVGITTSEKVREHFVKPAPALDHARAVLAAALGGSEDAVQAAVAQEIARLSSTRSRRPKRKSGEK